MVNKRFHPSIERLCNRVDYGINYIWHDLYFLIRDVVVSFHGREALWSILLFCRCVARELEHSVLLGKLVLLKMA